MLCELSHLAATSPFSRSSAELPPGTCLPSHLRRYGLRMALPLFHSRSGRPFHQVVQLCGILGLRWKLLERDVFFLVELESVDMKAWNSQARSEEHTQHCSWRRGKWLPDGRAHRASTVSLHHPRRTAHPLYHPVPFLTDPHAPAAPEDGGGACPYTTSASLF